MIVDIAFGIALLILFIYLHVGLEREREQLYALLTLQAEQFGDERAKLLDRVQAPEYAVAASLTAEATPRRMYRTEDDEVRMEREQAAALMDAELRARGIQA